MANRWSRLGGWLGIPVGGVGVVLRRMAFHAVFVAGVTQVKSASNALYLSRRDPEGLALLYILVAVTVAVASALLSRSLHGRRPLQLLRQLGIVLAVALLGLFGLLHLQLAPVYGLLYIVGELYATVLSVLFWADASERFDVREQKRIVGLLAAGGMVGAILGGGLVAPLARLIGVDGLVALSGLTLALALPLLGSDHRERREQTRAAGPQRSAMSALFADRYPRHIALLVGSLSVLATLVDYHFRVSSAGHLDEGELASLFGQLNAVVGVAGLAFQTAFTSRLLAGFGVFVFLGLIPVLAGAMAVAIQLSGLFVLTIALKGVEMAGSYSLYQPGLQLLYNPIDPRTRHALRPLIDGAAKKLGVAVGGLGLLGLAASHLHGVVLPLVVLTVIGIVLLLRSLRHGYIATLDQRLGGRRLQVNYQIDATDKITREALLRALHSESSREVLTALAILERAPDYDVTDELRHCWCTTARPCAWLPSSAPASAATPGWPGPCATSSAPTRGARALALPAPWPWWILTEPPKPCGLSCTIRIRVCRWRWWRRCCPWSTRARVQPTRCWAPCWRPWSTRHRSSASCASCWGSWSTAPLTRPWPHSCTTRIPACASWPVSLPLA
ncbi:MAG: Npt1/Npt2 family nucleotide transporter [Pseudomonadota bacterium]